MKEKQEQAVTVTSEGVMIISEEVPETVKRRVFKRRISGTTPVILTRGTLEEITNSLRDAIIKLHDVIKDVDDANGLRYELLKSEIASKASQASVNQMATQASVDALREDSDVIKQKLAAILDRMD